MVSGYDLLIAFPPCKYLCSSGLHWNSRVPGRAAQTESALEFVRWLMGLPIKRICIENPVGCLSSRIRRPDQLIHPHQFGHDASKKTCLWLTNLPHLVPTQPVAPRFVATGRGTQTLPRWGNQFDSGQNNLVSAQDRAERRAERWQGIIEAMAEQWGVL